MSAFYAYKIINTSKNQSQITYEKKGIVETWSECKSIVSGITAKYRKFKYKSDAIDWLNDIPKQLPKGIYFDSGKRRNNSTRIKITNELGDLLSEILTLKSNKTNNYGELYALKLALEMALESTTLESTTLESNQRMIIGDSKLVIGYWSKSKFSKYLDDDTKNLINLVSKLRIEYESKGSKIMWISGNDNPADLGYHRRRI